MDFVAMGDPPYAAPLRAAELVGLERSEDELVLHASQVVRASDPYMSGHFPELAIFPGVFLIEALRQTVGWALGEKAGAMPEIRTLRSARFLAPLLDGDSLTLEATIKPASASEHYEVDACCRRGDGVTASRLKAEFHYGAAGA